MKNILRKIDWILIFRSSVGAMFLYIAYTSNSWPAAFFGIAFIIVALIASIRKKGCGYDGTCSIDSYKNTANKNV